MLINKIDHSDEGSIIALQNSFSFIHNSYDKNHLLVYITSSIQATGYLHIHDIKSRTQAGKYFIGFEKGAPTVLKAGIESS